MAGEGGGADAGGMGSSRGMEAYGKLCMANLHLYTAPSDRRRDDARHRAENHLSHALELYRRVLEKDPGGGGAGVGVGAEFFGMRGEGRLQRGACCMPESQGICARPPHRAGNVYAANGVGCVLAETGHLNSAKDVFLQASGSMGL